MRPFHCGSQYAEWEDLNCMQCKKGSWSQPGKCEIQAALFEAYVFDGEVSHEIWRRMGHDEKEHPYVWRCPEFEKEGENKDE